MTTDPLLKLPERELFLALSSLCDGRETSEVACAALNLVVNSIRQTKSTLKEAEEALDAVISRTRGVLAAHYDAGGRKKGIFPYDQVVTVEHFISDDRF